MWIPCSIALGSKVQSQGKRTTQFYPWSDRISKARPLITPRPARKSCLEEDFKSEKATSRRATVSRTKHHYTCPPSQPITGQPFRLREGQATAEDFSFTLKPEYARRSTALSLAPKGRAACYRAEG